MGWDGFVATNVSYYSTSIHVFFSSIVLVKTSVRVCVDQKVIKDAVAQVFAGSNEYSFLQHMTDQV